MPSKKAKKIDFEKLSLEEQIELVNKALEAEVYTAMAMHNGGLDIEDIDGLTVYISYQGACVGCPMAATGTLMFVENTLQEKIDPRIRVKIL
ncbi:NifU family protein [Candidatus Peregrinibacteria bacterium]|nr:NifU family protein [Candidatus Peregrinibacteria bacterium]